MQDERFWTEGGRYWLRGERVPGEDDPADYWIENWRRFKEDPGEIDRLVASGVMTERQADNPGVSSLPGPRRRSWRKCASGTRRMLLSTNRATGRMRRTITPANRLWASAGMRPWPTPTGWPTSAHNPTGCPPRRNGSGRREGDGVSIPGAATGIRTSSTVWKETNRVMRTTPVGVYPNGATPDGIQDMSGNVWEWTATRYAEYPYDPEQAWKTRPQQGCALPAAAVGRPTARWCGAPIVSGTIRGTWTTTSDFDSPGPLSSFVLCPLSAVH